MAFSGFQDFVPNFGSALQSFIAASPGISVGSGYRDVARQQQLWNRALQKYGSPQAARKWVAPPGHSYHNKGLAADLQFASPAALQWAHDNAARYGLGFPLGNENWHIELAGARGGGAGNATSLAPPPDIGTLLASGIVQTPPGRDEINALAETSAGSLPSASSTRRTEEAQPMLREGRRQETPNVSLETNLGDTGQAAPTPSPAPKLLAQLENSMAPLAELFNVRTIGQAGVPKAQPLPGRRF